jgi:hypothetical protein
VVCLCREKKSILTCNIRRIVPPRRLPNSIDELNLLRRQFDLRKVLDDARWSHRFGDHAVSADFGPGEDHLCGRDGRTRAFGDALGDFLDFVAGDEERDADYVVSEGLDTEKKKIRKCLVSDLLIGKDAPSRR